MQSDSPGHACGLTAGDQEREFMQSRLRNVIVYLREHNVLHRVGVVASAMVIAFAFYILYHQIKGIDTDAFLAALRDTDRSRIAWAALFVAAGYLTLTFYDLFALRTIGRHDIPYRIAALAGFTSYSVGHNVGASVFSGGAVRYRIYSAHGLDATDVAKLCFVAGLTFWLGNAAMLGLGVSYHPEAASAVDLLPPLVNRGLALALIAGLIGYVIWVSTRPRYVGRGSWSVELPGGGLTLLQIAIGIVDLTCCALAMYVLMPMQPPIDFVTLGVIFISATLLGFASHSPGGLGVFDAAMLVGLSQFDKSALLASLLLFRVLYYITPFLLSLIILGIREALIALRATRADSPPRIDAG